jgi:ATP-dependent Zn protease
MISITRLTPARRLAQSRSPLADMLIDSVRREAEGANKTVGTAAAQRGQLPLALDHEDVADAGAGADLPGAPPSRYAVAVLLGCALDADRAGLARLQDSDAVTLIEVPSADMVEPVRGFLKRHVLGAANVISPAELRNGSIGLASPGAVEIFTDRDDGRVAKAEQTDDLVGAVRVGCAVIGISADPERLLPQELVRMAAIRIKVPRFDEGTVTAVIRAVTAAEPGPIGAGLVAAVTLQALDLAVRPDLGAATSLDRLRLLVGGVRKDESSPVPLADMHGLGEAKKWALDLVADLKAYGRGELPWSAVAPGVVLWSRPGCGKTAIARALARDSGFFFIATSYAQWQAHKDGHLGHVTQAIRNTFAEARKKAPTVIYVDEIDTLGTRGATASGGISKRDEDWWRAIVNVLLEELDGFERREGVAVIAACNDPSRLDPALVRSGRLDRLVEIPLPDVPALAGIFRTYLRDDLSGDNLIDIALNAHGGTGADVERWVRDTRAVARREGRTLTKADLADVVRGDRQELPEPVRWRVGYHEAGHALVMAASGIGRPVSLSISVKGGLSYNEPGERRALTRDHLERHLMVMLAGRAAEVLVYGEGTAGAGGSEDSDLGAATMMATRLETAYGLGNSGLLYLPVEPERQFLFVPDVRSAVTKTLGRVHGAAVDLLARNRPLLDALAEALFERGYLDAQGIGTVLDRFPLRSPEGTAPPKAVDSGMTSSPETADDDPVQSPSRP